MISERDMEQSLFRPSGLALARRDVLAFVTVWSLVCVLVGNEIAVGVGWWSFGGVGLRVGSTPLVVWLGWAALWGPIAARVQARIPVKLIALAVVDFVAMPRMGHVFELGPHWIVGEVILRVVVVVPGLWLVRRFAVRS